MFRDEGEADEPVWQLLMRRERPPLPQVSRQATCIDSKPTKSQNRRCTRSPAAAARIASEAPVPRWSHRRISSATKPDALDERAQSHSARLRAVKQRPALSHSRWSTRHGDVRAVVRAEPTEMVHAISYLPAAFQTLCIGPENPEWSYLFPVP